MICRLSRYVDSDEFRADRQHLRYGIRHKPADYRPQLVSREDYKPDKKIEVAF